MAGIRTLRAPQNAKDAHRKLGIIGHYGQRYLPSFGILAAPFHKLKGKNSAHLFATWDTLES